MTATRTATEHKRRAYSPIVNEVQLAALRWLDERGLEYDRGNSYWQNWMDCDTVDGVMRRLELRVATTTLRALEHRGLVEWSTVRGERFVMITDAGRECLRKAKQ